MPYPYPWSSDIEIDPASVPSPVYAIKDASGNVTGLIGPDGKINPVSTHTPPPGFDVPDQLSGIYAYRNGDSWGCNITPDSLIDASVITNTYYVDPVGGSDANSGLTWALRKKSIGNAMRTAAVAAVSSRILLYAGNGPFWRQMSMSDDSIARTNAQTIVIESICGRAKIGPFDNLTWSATLTKSFTAARSNSLRVINTSKLDNRGLPSEYVWAASSAAVDATAGTWFTDGTSVWVHPHGDEVATLDNCKVIVGAINFKWQSNANLLIRGVDFIGGNSGCLQILGGSTNKVVVDDCTFGFSALSNTYNGGTTITDNVQVLGCGLFAAFNCKCYAAGKDGFNFHRESDILPNALLVNCVGNHNGLSPSESNNGFTTHDGVTSISIGCDWTANNGTGSGHVSDGTSVWSVGDVAGASAGDAPTGGAITYAGFGVWSGAATMWLDSCRDVGALIGVYAGSGGAAINLRNHRGSGQRAGDLTTY